MKTIYMTPREFVRWFAKEHPVDGQEMTYVRLASGREIYFDTMTDEDANLIASQFSFWASKPQGQT